MSQIREFLSQSLAQLSGKLSELETNIQSETNADSARLHLWKTLQLRDSVDDVHSRIEDMTKNLQAISDQLTELYNGIENIEKQKTFAVQEAIEENTKNLEDAAKAGERGNKALEIMQVILAGNLSFDLLDRWSLENPIDGDYPLWWFLISMAFFVLTAVILSVYSSRASAAAEKVMMLKFKLNRAVDPTRMRAYIDSKSPDAESFETHLTGNLICKIAWAEESEEEWTAPGCSPSPPEIVLMYDHKFGYALQVYMTIVKVDNMMSDKQYLHCFYKQLYAADVLARGAASGVEGNLIKLIEEEAVDLAKKNEVLEDAANINFETE